MRKTKLVRNGSNNTEHVGQERVRKNLHMTHVCCNFHFQGLSVQRCSVHSLSNEQPRWRPVSQWTRHALRPCTRPHWRTQGCNASRVLCEPGSDNPEQRRRTEPTEPDPHHFAAWCSIHHRSDVSSSVIGYHADAQPGWKIEPRPTQAMSQACFTLKSLCVASLL